MSTAAKKRLMNVPRLSAWGGISLLASLPALFAASDTFADVIYTDSDIPTANIVSGADGVGNITFDIANEGTYNNIISGSGSVTKTGEGSLTITADDGGQTYTGGTTVSAGTLYLYANNRGKSSVGTGDLIINSGAKVEAKTHNVLGSGQTDVIINGGTLQPYQYLHMRNLEINGGTVTGSDGGTGLDFERRDGTITSTGTSSIASAIRHSSTVTFDVQDGTLSLTGTVHNDGGTKTIKTGAGTLTTSNWMNSIVEVQEGTLQITGGFGDGKRFNGEATIAEGAQLLCASHDSLGYSSANTKLHVYGLLDNTSGNETLNNTEIHMYGGTTQSSSNGTLDILNTGVKYYSHALEGATAEAPTVSTISAPTRLRTDGTFEIITDANSQLNITGVISRNSGNANIVKLGEGTMVLSARSTYTNGITIQEGKVIANAGNASASTFGTGLVVVEAGALLEFQVANQLGYGANAPNDITIRGTLKPHTYTHIKNVTLEGGTIETEYAYDGGATGLDFGSRTGVITSTGESAIKSRIHINSGANATFNVTSGNLTLSGILKSDGGFTKTGDGTLTLRANKSTLSGNVTIDAGKVLLAAGWSNPNSVLGPAVDGRIIYVNEGAELSFGAQDVFSDAHNNNLIQFVVDGGKISNTGAFYNYLQNLTLKDGAELYAVNGNANWKAYKLHNVNVLRNDDGSAAAPVRFTSAANSPNAVFCFGAKTSEVASGTSILNIQDITSASADTIDNLPDLIISGVIADPKVNASTTQVSKIQKTGTGMVELTAANTFTGQVTVSEGVLRLSESAVEVKAPIAIDTAGTLDLNVAEGAEKSFANQISGTGQFVKSGAGTLKLTANCGFAGDILITEGKVLLTASRSGSNSALGVVKAGRTIYINEGTELNLGLQDVCTSAHDSNPLQFVVDGGKVSNTGVFYNFLQNTTFKDGAELHAVDGNAIWKAYKIQNVNVLRNDDGSAAAPVLFTSAENKPNAVFCFGAPTNDVTTVTSTLNVQDITSASADTVDDLPDLIISGVVANPTVNTQTQETRAGAIKKTGTGMVELTAANTFTGQVTLSEGVLRLTDSAIDLKAPIAIEAAGRLDLNAGEGVEKTFSSTVTGTGEVLKLGAGTLNVNAVNGFEVSSLDVSAGRLNFQGSMTGNLTLADGTVFSPGSGIGTTTLDGNFTAESGTQLVFEIGAQTSDLLLLDSGSTLNVSEGAVLKLLFTDANEYKKYTLIETKDGLGDYDTAFWSSLLTFESSLPWEVSVVGNSLLAGVDRSAVPEPAAWVLLVLGAAGLYCVRRKNRK